MAPPEGALYEATRRAIRQWQPGERARGVPCGLTVGTAGRCGCGATRGRINGVAVEEMRGNPEIHTLRRRRIGDSRRLEAPSPVQRKDAGREATRERIWNLNGTMLDLSNV